MRVPAALHQIVIGSLFASMLPNLAYAQPSSAAGGSATELRILPTKRCIWSHHGAPDEATEKGIFGGAFEALAPGLIDTGIAWIGEMLKEAGERKVTPRYAAASVGAGPDYALPNCLQLVYGTFALAGGTPSPAMRDVDDKELLADLSGMYFATTEQAPHLWLEAEIHYFPKERFIDGIYQSPKAYALVPTRLSWSRSLLNGKPVAHRDLLVFVNISAPVSAANEATTGFSNNPASVARLSWYALSAGKPLVETVFAGRATKPNKTTPGQVTTPAAATQFTYALPPTASAWAPFPSNEKNQPIVFWANVTEARDGNKALKMLGQALAARKAEVSTALGEAIIPSKKDAAEVAANAAEIDVLKAYLAAATETHLQASAFRQECKKYAAAMAANDQAETDAAFNKVIEESGKLLEKMNTAQSLGLKTSPKQQPYSDQVMRDLQIHLSQPQDACKVNL